MSIALALGVTAAVYLAFLAVLVVSGRREDARALARFIPDCVVLLRRLLGDARVPRRHKVLLGAVVAYLLSPIDLVPDVIPVAGQLDDAIVVALALRAILRAAGPAVVAEHWPGPERGLRVVLRG